VRIVIKRLS